MIKNNKGFMLAEVVIVSAVLITTLTSLYVGFSKVYKAYQERSEYFDTDTIYALKNIEDMLIDEDVFNYLAGSIGIDNYMDISNIDLILSPYIKNYINTIMDNYNIDKCYLVEYDKVALYNFIWPNYSPKLELYVEYIIKNTDEDDWLKYQYIFIAETKSGKFAYLRVV